MVSVESPSARGNLHGSFRQIPQVHHGCVCRFCLEEMTMLEYRSSGILLPISALPGPYGIGMLGEQARRFVDFLAAGGQHYWQIRSLVLAA